MIMKIPTFSKDVRQGIMDGQRGYCKGCLAPIQDFHHMLHNTVANRKLFPNFIHSIWNCVGLCRDCHLNGDPIYKVTEEMAIQYEQALRLWIPKQETITR